MNRKALIFLIKLLIGFACFGFIYYKLKDQFTDENLVQLKATFNNFKNVILLLIAFVLLFANWGIECYKWQIITSPIERKSYLVACKSVLTGIFIGNLTPGRIGEFAGRILFFKPEHRGKIGITHFVCGLSQLFITVFVGIPALVFIAIKESGDGGILFPLLAICSFLLLGLIFLVININAVYKWVSTRKVMARFNLGVVTYDGRLLWRLILYSLLRYFVFSLQYYLLLYAVGVDSDGLRVICSIAVSFMLMSSIPMISFIEVAVRAAIAIMLFGKFQQNSLQLISASTLLWLINIVLPSVVGYVITVKEKFEFSSLKR